jgi:hypothetical protein
MVTSPKTGRVWLDRNLGATQVATKVDDSAAFLLLRSTQASAPKSILRLSLKALLAMAKLVNFCLYHVFSDEKLVNSVKERGRSGYDVKFSGQAPYLPWAKIKARSDASLNES